jgi:NAD-dependent deacetylase
MDETGDKAPMCECGGFLKQATISFGQSLPLKALEDAEEKSAACDMFIVAGSSLVVYPAAQMPVMARQNGAKLIIITLSNTPHDPYADIVINDKTGPTLSRIVEAVKTRLQK